MQYPKAFDKVMKAVGVYKVKGDKIKQLPLVNITLPDGLFRGQNGTGIGKILYKNNSLIEEGQFTGTKLNG